MRTSVRRRWLRSIPDSRDVAEPLDNPHRIMRPDAHVREHVASGTLGGKWSCMYIMSRKQYTDAR